MLYDELGRSFASSVMLCMGTKDEEGDDILNLTKEPWQLLETNKRAKKKIKLLKPSSEVMKSHILWRWVNICNSSPPTPRPKQWTLRQITEWFQKNPITGADNISFLTSEVAKEKTLALASIQRGLSENQSLLGRNWTGEVPYLRLIHALVDDDNIKSAFLHRSDLSSDRMVIENRNSTEQRVKTVWEMLSEKWNNPLFNPVSVEVPDLHSNFGAEISLAHRKVADFAPATPEKIQHKIATLIVLLTRRIAAWEQSGQGDGGGHDDDDEAEEDEERTDRPSFGSFSNRPQGALDQRHAFFEHEQQYLLYWWHMLEVHDLLSCSLSRIAVGVASENGGDAVPSVVIRAVASAAGASLSIPGDLDSNHRQELDRLSSSINNMTRMEEEQREMNRVADAARDQINNIRLEIRSTKSSIETLKSEKRVMVVKHFESRNDEAARSFMLNN